MEDTDAKRPLRAHAFVRLLTIALLASAAGLSACGPSGDQAASSAGSSAGSRAGPPSSSPPMSLAAENAAFAAAQTQAMLQALTQAPQQGFSPGAFGDVQQMANLVASTDQAQQGQGQKLLRAAIIKYARAQHGLGLPTDQFPKEKKNPGYFARNDFVKGPSAAVPLVQKAGPKSALGQVKFEFDNAYGVYLHDTPSKTAFDLDAREVSHGCVRLQRALDLAKVLLDGVKGYSPGEIDQLVMTDNTQFVNLAQPVPVMIFYWTAFVQDGQTYFGSDPYGWDDMLVRLLDAGPSSHA